MGLKEIGKNIYLIPGSPSTLIIKSEKTILVDPGKGTHRHKDIMRETMKISTKPEVILATHTHADHIEIVPKLDLPLYVHENEFSSAKNKLVRDLITIGSKMLKNFLNEADRLNMIKNVKTFKWEENLFGVKTIKLDGHSPGMTGFSIENIVYAGDSFFGGLLLEKVGIPFFVDYDLFLNSLIKLLEYAEKDYKLIPSHGQIVEGENAMELIKKNIAKTKKIIEIAIDILSRPKCEDSLLKELMKKLNAEIIPFSLYLNKVPIRAILAKLVNENKVEIIVDNNIMKFKSV